VDVDCDVTSLEVAVDWAIVKIELALPHGPGKWIA